VNETHVIQTNMPQKCIGVVEAPLDAIFMRKQI